MPLHVTIIPLVHQKPSVYEALITAKTEAAKVWNDCAELFYAAFEKKERWPTRGELQVFTKGGQYELYSQTVQMIANAVGFSLSVPR